MHRELKLSELMIVLFLFFLAGVGVYYYVNTLERNKLRLQLYPIQAQIEQYALQCNENSPTWLAQLLKQTTLSHRAPNTQVAYLSPQGQLFHCQSGYLGLPLLSAKVNENTRFRYASVTKLWTSDAVLDLIKQNKFRSEERRVGKECRSRWSVYDEKK